MQRLFTRIIIFIILLQQSAIAQTNAQKDDLPLTRILFILDASGSMSDKWEGRPRMDVAREVLSSLVDSLKNVSRVELALRAYGHEWDKRYNNCKDTKLEVGFSPGNHEAIKNKIKKIQPLGTTLISFSLEQAAKDFPDDKKNVRNVIILITDGIESCGGDPCALSIALQKKKIFLKPFIIGIGADENFQKAFSCMGQYYEASQVKDFRKTLDKILTQTLKETTVVINLLDSNGKPKETNVNISFVNNLTGETAYDYVHYIHPNGKPEVVKIDPLLSYDIVVNTIPKVVKANVSFEGGIQNVVNISTPQGSILLKNHYKEYANLQYIIRESGNPNTLHIQKAGVRENLLIGSYDIEILTVPRTYIKEVRIKQSETTLLSLPQPGVLNVPEMYPGYASIYLIKDNGEQEWVYNVENETSKTFLAMQPGNYKFVFRSKKAMGSEYTDVQYFTIRSGATTLVKLFAGR